MSCPANYPNKQKVQAQDEFSSVPNNFGVNKLYLSYLSNVDHKGILISSVKEGCKTRNRIPLKLQHFSDCGFLQLNYKGPKFHDYFPPDSTVKVNEILLKKAATKKNKFSLEDIHNGPWNIVHITTGKKSDCNYLFEKAIKDNYTVILTILLQIIDTNNSSRQFVLYLSGINGSLLHRAVEQKDIKVVKALLKCELDINARNETGCTPLLVAVDLEIPDIVDLLINNGANVNASNRELQIPLHYAVKINSDFKIIDSLLRSRVRIDEKDKEGRTPLFYAVAARNVDVIDILLKKGAKYELTDRFDHTAFHLAAQKFNLDLIEVFLKNNVNADILNSRRQTPLFYVSQKPRFSQSETVYEEKYLKIIHTLIKHGANINVQDSEGRTPFHAGVINNNIEFVEALLKHNADVTIQNKCGKNVLHVACEFSRNKCIQLLLNCNIDINAINSEGKTAIHVAVETKNCYAVELILKKNPNINMSDSLGETPLHLALESDCLPIIELLLKNKANVNLKDSFGRTALHLALNNPHITIKIIKSVLNSINNINVADNDERTVLRVAVEQNNYGAVKLILEKNPNINMTDKSQKTALHCALESMCLPIVELLLKNKADVNLKDNFGKTALHLASENPKITINIVKSILNSTSNINVGDSYGWTAVHYAALNHNIKTIKYLIEKSANVNAKDSEERTPLHIAMDPENEYTSSLKCVKTFLDYKADINAVDKDLICPLHMACFAKNAKVIKYLIKNGADSNMRDKDGKTVFHYACMLGLNKELLWIDKDVEEHTRDTLNVLVEENISVNCFDRFGKTPLHCATDNKLPFMSELLLNIGADINILDKDHKSVLDNLTKLSAPIHDSPNELFVLYAKHIMKIKIMKSWVQKKILDKIYKVNNKRYLEWIQYCKSVYSKEIDLMKSTNFDQSITYYDFLKKSPHDAVNFTRNQNIVKAIQSDELISMFPVYGYFLKSLLREALQRNFFYEEIQKSLKTYVFEKLPTLCMTEILRYLNISELAVLLEAMKPVVVLVK